MKKSFRKALGCTLITAALVLSAGCSNALAETEIGAEEESVFSAESADRSVFGLTTEGDNGTNAHGGHRHGGKSSSGKDGEGKSGKGGRNSGTGRDNNR